MRSHRSRRTTRWLSLLLLAGLAGCIRGGPLGEGQLPLVGTWVSASGARLVIRADGSCDYEGATEQVADGSLVMLGTTLRCKRFFGGVSLTVDRGLVTDHRGTRPRTYLTLSGVEYTRRDAPDD